MVVEEEVGAAGDQRNVFLRAAIANHVVMVIMQLMDHAWPWSMKRLEDMPDFDLHMMESERGVLFRLPPSGIE